ncbi:MAG: hypothetical protein R3B09_28120 [Nannocystaceae bacterium]
MTITGGPEVNALEGLFKAVADNAHLPLEGAGAAPSDRGWIVARVAAIRDGTGVAAPGASVATVEGALGPFYRYGYSRASAGAAAGQTSPLQAYFSVLMRIQGPSASTPAAARRRASSRPASTPPTSSA